MISQEQILQFQEYILSWYETNQRDILWRHTKDPYAIMISEMMSQQTQVSRVIPKYSAWMERFPTVEKLAKASTKDVLLYWSGLGYNRRALYVKKAADIITREYAGKFPEDVTQLQKLPGIGEYTAAAIACFAFNAQIPVIDTNVRKVIALTFCNGIVPDKKDLINIATNLVPEGKAYVWNQALMDYAALQLKQQKIAIPKQSPFKDSDRYYRGQIIKLLLEGEKTFLQLQKALLLERVRLKKIILSLCKDKVIILRSNTYAIIP